MKVKDLFEKKSSIGSLVKQFNSKFPDYDAEDINGMIHILKNDKEVFFGDHSDFNEYFKGMMRTIREQLTTDQLVTEDLELKKLIDREITNPLNKNLDILKSKLIKDFIPKLKAWAIAALPTATKLGETHKKNIEKYLKHPEKAAEQLIDAVLSKRLKSA